MLKVNSPLARPQPMPLPLLETLTPKAAPLDHFEAARRVQKAPAPFVTPSWSSVIAEDDSLRYVIAPGDTLGQIAARFGTNVETLIAMNRISQPDRIEVGAKLSLPTTFHQVREGDTWESIAARTGLSPDVLKAVNQWVFEDGGDLSPGVDVRAPAAVMTPKEAQTLESLKALVTNDAQAHDALFGGTVDRAMHCYGFSIGWGDGGEASTFEYSDDLRALQLGPEALTAQSRFALSFPVDDTRRVMVLNMLEAIRYQYALVSGVDLEQHPMPERTTLPDGRIQFTFLGPDAKPTTVIHSLNNGGIAIKDDTGETVWWGNATTPLETMDLARQLGMTLPVQLP